MRPDFIEQMRRRLLKLDCPISQMERLTGEVSDHYEDLRQNALAEGLSEAEAETLTQTQLGDPQYLAEQKMAVLRQSSWWGRHFLISFCLLPLLTVPLLWLLFLFFYVTLGFVFGYGGNVKKLDAAAGNPATFHHMVIELQWADYLAIAMVAMLFCWLARRSAVSLAWMVSACAICSFYALFLSAQIRPHNFFLGIYSVPHWFRAAIPMLIAGVVYAVRQWMIRNEHRGNSRLIKLQPIQ